jgi:hypothetical protein
MREGEKGIDTFEPFNPEYPKHNINTQGLGVQAIMYRRYPREISIDSISSSSKVQ